MLLIRLRACDKVGAMSETYDAVYSAVRSRITGGDVGSAVEQAVRDQNWSHYVMQAFERITQEFCEYSRPSVLFRPRLAKDGDAWIACYGDNLAEGCVGSGTTPAAAMASFDIAWNKTAACES